ncbi:hypothetical protein AQUCO_02700026v1 [Aquilegia coerulea]|uniref:RING-type domain-containing protein n=1 Tax=Aquilegia coerulea TaxID=218851 RepID=A0A2G5D4U5_AQUCA|nr:hypothetical protein AQUCO_02700026v1 [Aquilegia coerulea]
MGRRKQSRPLQSGGVVANVSTSVVDNHIGVDVDAKCTVVVDTSRFFEIDQSYWVSDKHLDIAEVIVRDSRPREVLLDCCLTEDCFTDSRFSFRFRLHDVEEYSERFKIGTWPVISTDQIFLEILEACAVEDHKEEVVVFTGIFDGPDDSVSGLVHLVSKKMLMVRPIQEVRVVDDVLTLTMRVEILDKAFDACESLLDNTREPWRRSMVSVMAWLRPEVTTQDTIYGVDGTKPAEFDMQMDSADNHIASRRNIKFNAADFYEAIKPSKDAPMLEDELPDLLPELRPYQRRAAYWMVEREKGMSQSSGDMDQYDFQRPLCVPMNFLYSDSRMFYNPFSGSVSLHPESSTPYTSGGILADEMGLGKTVELLACIFAHRKSMSEGTPISEILTQKVEGQKNGLRRSKIERVECICGALSESPKYKGIWVQCDVCDAWQHADCKSASDIVEMDGNYICQLCSELIQASQSPVDTGATLIVCPSPILHQWHAEIMRHTRPGSIKTCIYEGVKNASLSATPTMDISELVSADIVLTTYDVLKEDLSHDSDRNDGDRRSMRFDKRYPVIPTLLTRLYFWRVCLDEAQMVESNTAAATEMALRLHAKYHWCITGTPIQRRFDDMYGLLKFLSATPFEVRRWWLEVIKDPYERGDVGAMEFAHKFFKQIMWRSLKVHVRDELQLPTQEQCVCWLSFSPIEAYFYQKQHESCMNSAHEVIKSYKEDIKKFHGSQSYDASSDSIVTYAEAAKLLHSLLKLRQACCHPQVGSSGLRSIQHHSPMTMEEILGVLVSKSKTEGEDALRSTVSSLNGLAGIAMIEGDLPRAVSLYREALSLAEEHSNDFKLDPLLNYHIHHNLAEIFTQSNLSQIQSMKWELPENAEKGPSNLYEINDINERSGKRQKTCNERSSYLTSIDGHLELQGKENTSDQSMVGLNGSEVMEYDSQRLLSFKSYLRMMCDSIKKKFLAGYDSKLSQAQQEFRHSYMQLLERGKNNHRGTGTFRSISGMKYAIQTSLDLLESSRLALIERILEIDKTMEEPRDQDIAHMKYCQNCQKKGDGPICIRCEMGNLCQEYAVRLFFCKKEGNAGRSMVASAEEAMTLQKKSSTLNNFFEGLFNPNNDTSSTIIGNEKNKKQRNGWASVTVQRSASELEIVLSVLKTFSKGWLGKDGLSAATKHMFLFEVMRKEFVPASSLATAQIQMLCAHGELKDATSRLRLRETDTDTSIDAISPEGLVDANIQNSSDKFMSLTLLSRMKGQIRYLKRLVLSKAKADSETSSMHVDTDNSGSASQRRELDESGGKFYDETCPICQDNLSNQKMVFQCGHVTCCKCLVAMTNRQVNPPKKLQEKWIMCPTCRQRTDFSNIACADDRQSKTRKSSLPNTSEGHEKPEASIDVQGSYGTKIEAITRRILWIKCTEPMSKVLVFSSWNDVLDVLEHALAANHISHIRMKGGRNSHFAISRFKGNTDDAKGNHERCSTQPGKEFFQVMLLLVQHGANGLNLLEAKHVILVEPLLNPAAEAQAINRVHRIGQDKRTVVHRFIVKDTVEESIYKLNSNRTTNTIISGNTKNKDQPVLTIKDVESLFSSTIPAIQPEHEDIPVETLMHFPPAVAAAIAAERRWKEGFA